MLSSTVRANAFVAGPALPRTRVGGGSASFRTFTALRQAKRRRTSTTTMSAAQFEAHVKGDPATNTLGDCPFCHRALLTLELKKAPYKKYYIDFAHKPEWLFKINPKGSVPAVKDVEADKWLTDSADIVDYLEEKYPEPKLGKSDSIPDVGSQVFPSFVKFLTSSGSEAEEAKEKLTSNLGALSSHLKSKGPYIMGGSISAADVALAPKLYHVLIASKHYKGYELSAELSPVSDYLAKLQATDAWKNTYYSPDLVIQGWESKAAK